MNSEYIIWLVLGMIGSMMIQEGYNRHVQRRELIKVEDLIFGFALILSVLQMWAWAGRRTNARE